MKIVTMTLVLIQEIEDDSLGEEIPSIADFQDEINKRGLHVGADEDVKIVITNLRITDAS